MESDQFTLQEANDLVPWLEETFQRLTGLRDEIAGLRSRAGGEAVDPDQGELEALERGLDDGFQEILDRGIIVRNIASGLVDFPSQREGREVYLCWIGGEERIDFWHETDQGFAHRQPL